ncbi:MAG: DUF1801 domain-containing protein [Bacillota bacterium]
MSADEQAIETYLETLTPERKNAMETLRSTLKAHLPGGFQETFQYGMITYAVPLSTYPEGYHVKKNTPLSLISIASRKQSINLYHHGIYMDPGLLEWFQKAHQEKLNKKPDMGKSCIRFKSIDDDTLGLVAELSKRMDVETFIRLYESARNQ